MSTLYQDGALADGRSDRLELGVSILVEGDRITWIRPADDEGPSGPSRDLEVVDASGSTFVPGLIDSHSHLALPGGARWLEHIDDPPELMLQAAEHNARLLTGAGVRWARDVGSPIVTDPVSGATRALAITLRDRWAGKRGYPHVRAAGTHLFKTGTIASLGRRLDADDAAQLLANATRQLDDGATLLKLYLDGPEPGVSPWMADEIRPVIEMAHARGAKVTAHSGYLAGARVAVEAGVDSIEHGMELDEEVVARMAGRDISLVSTLSVFRSWLSFGRTTALPRFASEEGRSRILARQERAEESVRLAHRAGVRIATGTDFGGGSTRANQLAWEVECLVAAGLEPWEALASATWRGGELLGEPDAGVIREGGPADFALVHGDPLSDPTALWRVWRVAWADWDAEPVGGRT